MSALAIPRISPELYLDLDRAAEGRSEYLDGLMYSMAGASLAHASLSVAIGAALWQALRGSKCRVLSNDVRTMAGTGNAYFYPDCSVYCEAPQPAGDRNDIFTNPTLVVEITSRSTEAYDRGEKFRQYRKLESLRQYVLVSQTEPRIEVFSKQTEGEWTSAVYTDICPLESIGCEISVHAVYEGITLDQE